MSADGVSEAAIDAIMRIMDAAFDPQWGEAWNRSQVASALILSHTHASLLGLDGTVPADPDEAVGFAIVLSLASFTVGTRDAVSANDAKLRLVGDRVTESAP